MCKVMEDMREEAVESFGYTLGTIAFERCA